MLCISGYISDVELARQAEQEEAAAQQFLSQGSVEAQGIVEVLDKLNKPDQLPMYYMGGLRILSQALRNSKYCRQ